MSKRMFINSKGLSKESVLKFLVSKTNNTRTCISGFIHPSRPYIFFGGDDCGGMGWSDSHPSGWRADWAEKYEEVFLPNKNIIGGEIL